MIAAEDRGVQSTQRVQALVEDAAAALLVDVLLEIARQRAKQRTALLSEESWQVVLAGFELDTGQTRSFTAVSDEGLGRALECAGRVAERFGVPEIERLGTGYRLPLIRAAPTLTFAPPLTLRSSITSVITAPGIHGATRGMSRKATHVSSTAAETSNW